MATSTITLKAQCLCRAQTFTTTVPVSSLPLKGSSCHCTSCRHVMGALRSSDAVWPGPREDIVTAADATAAAAREAPVLKRYAHSPRVNVLFCGCCGSGLFFEEWENADEARQFPGKASYLVFTGILSVEGEQEKSQSSPLPPVVRFEDHMFVGDTLDGGAACWLRNMNGEGQPATKIWLGRRNKSEEVPPGTIWPALENQPTYEVNLKEVEGEKAIVPIRCHCGGIDLLLHAGKAQREYAEKQTRGEELPRFVDPVTHKLLGSLDACDSCRIGGASEVYTWTFAQLKHISFAGADPHGFPENTTQLRAAISAKESRDPRFGEISFYASSSDVQRYFCGRCSATLFYAVDERPDMVDVAVGLLDSPDGARAESALAWNFVKKMGSRNDMIATWREGMLYAVEKELEEFRIGRGYPKSWRRIALEQAEEAAKSQ
ncbi:hypothetical protein VTI28DRAFT_3090 [Corynascus sepedonium]